MTAMTIEVPKQFTFRFVDTLNDRVICERKAQAFTEGHAKQEALNSFLSDPKHKMWCMNDNHEFLHVECVDTLGIKLFPEAM